MDVEISVLLWILTSVPGVTRNSVHFILFNPDLYPKEFPVQNFSANFAVHCYGKRKSPTMKSIYSSTLISHSLLLTFMPNILSCIQNYGLSVEVKRWPV